jgi:hypothetical protein
MSDIAKKVLLSIVLVFPSAVISYVLRKVFQAWGVFDSFSEWLGEWLKMHVSQAQVEWTIAGILALFAYAALLWIVWKHHHILPLRSLDGDVRSEIRPSGVVRNDALKISIGETADFELIQPRLDYVIRTVLACVENVDTSHFISSCKANVEINGIDHPLVDCFTLNPIEKRFIPIALRHESPIDKFIYILAIPKPGGIGGIQFRPTLPRSGGLITIKAKSAETRQAQLVCRVFVDDSGKLKMEKA